MSSALNLSSMPTLAAASTEQLGRFHVDRRGLDGDEAEAQLSCRRRGPDAAAAAVLVARLVEDLPRLGGVVVVLLVLGDVEEELAEARSQEHAARAREASHGDLAQLLSRQAVAEREAHVAVLQQRVAARLGVVGHVDPDVVERVPVGGDRLMSGASLSPRKMVGGISMMMSTSLVRSAWAMMSLFWNRIQVTLSAAGLLPYQSSLRVTSID